MLACDEYNKQEERMDSPSLGREPLSAQPVRALRTPLPLLAAALLCGLLLNSVSMAASPPPPAPTNVRVSDIQGINAKTGSFILEWDPAMIAPKTPHSGYQLGRGCTYETLQGEPAAVPAASGTWWFQTPGPRYRVRATCGCGYKVPGVRTLPAPNAGGSAWVMAPKFLLACVK